MNKVRLEALSDGVFSIVMTLLVIELKVPHLEGDSIEDPLMLWQKFYNLWPLIRSYFISFAILAMYWTSHHAFFHYYVKELDRRLSYLNLLFLMFVSLVPFSAHLLGEYPKNTAAIFNYGCNIILIGLSLYAMLRLIIRNKHMRHEDLSNKLIAQGTIRILLPPIFAFIGIFYSYYNISVSYFLFMFPIVFNIIPGTLDVPERFIFKMIKKRKAGSL